MGSKTWYVAVVGSGVCSSEIEALAYRVGYEIARRKGILICGGRGGVMAAASRGAREAGGIAVGILPGADRKEANPFLHVALPTGLGDARNAVIACAADVVIAIGGGYGTLSEVALALKKGKPVVTLAFTFGPLPGVEVARDPVEAVELALKKVNEC